ncbi:MAG: hypothetical protein H7122_05280 [Chitinophagaceae bacterium]|nr:hypothetical protein [Chitinophagaceae bacterium]
MERNKNKKVIYFRKLSLPLALLACFLFLFQFLFAQTLPADNQIGAKQKSRHKQNTSLYQTQLKIWCDALLKIQLQKGQDEGGIFCESHGFVHGRCGDAVYPLLTLFKLTHEEKYRTAARKVYRWSEEHVSQPDGSWLNEAGGKNNWKGITCFSVLAIGEALRHHSDLLTKKENEEWRERLRKGADFILIYQTFETGDINYPVSAAAALALCYKILGDERYLVRAKALADFGLQHFTENALIWGEGVRGPNDTTPKGLRPIDVPYNMEESLANFALYGTLMGDEKVLATVAASYISHLNWVLPDGSMDAGWCSRQYKWTYYGSATSDGPAGGLALMQKRDLRFGEAALRNLKLRVALTHDGLLHGGPRLFERGVPVCSHHTFTSIKGLATAIDEGIQNTADVSLPNDKAFGLREWPEASVTQIGVGPWRASVTTNDIASSPKRGGHPMGGSLAMLWHNETGPIAVASMSDYKLYEGSNMQKPVSDSALFSLTPRIEVISNGIRYSNVYDGEAKSRSFSGDSVQLIVQGHLRDSNGNVLPGANASFQLTYTFTANSFQMAIYTVAAGARLLFPIVAASSERVTYKADSTLAVQKNASRIKIFGSDKRGWESITNTRVFNFVPGFEAVPVQIMLDKNGKGLIRIEVIK